MVLHHSGTEPTWPAVISNQLTSILKQGGVAVLKTDTIYGLVGSALKPETVAKIYALKKRDPKKALIVLIADQADLAQFGVVLSNWQDKWLSKHWPGPMSVILTVSPWQVENFSYLHAGTGKIAFRLPADPNLQALLKQTGPLVAPSANLEGEPPAETIEQAKNYFGEQVDFYDDAGPCAGKASTLVDLTGEEEKILRA